MVPIQSCQIDLQAVECGPALCDNRINRINIMEVRREKRINVITVWMMEAKREKQQGCFAPRAYNAAP